MKEEDHDDITMDEMLLAWRAEMASSTNRELMMIHGPKMIVFSRALHDALEAEDEMRLQELLFMATKQINVLNEWAHEASPDVLRVLKFWRETAADIERELEAYDAYDADKEEVTAEERVRLSRERSSAHLNIIVPKGVAAFTTGIARRLRSTFLPPLNWPSWATTRCFSLASVLLWWGTLHPRLAC